MWFWVIFSMIHVLASLALSTQIYYMGRFKIGECCDPAISSRVCPVLTCLCSTVLWPLFWATLSSHPSHAFLASEVLVLLLPGAVGISRSCVLCWALRELPFSCSSPQCCAQRGDLHPVMG